MAVLVEAATLLILGRRRCARNPQVDREPQRVEVLGRYGRALEATCSCRSVSLSVNASGRFEAVRPAVECQEIDRAARRVITDAGYGERFIHRTGHGIGLTTHEPPYMVEGDTNPLEAGMCFSVEPGIYLSGRFGVRIEDIVTVTENGGRRLNNTTHELQIVA